jgi:catechol 2,3-dioxygenase-like lactoylglutathione lyase family enzyme
VIQKLSHATIYVLDQDVAKDFYVGKLGFEIKTDHTMPNGFRWLTVCPKGQSDFEIILMKVGSGGDFIKAKSGDTEAQAANDIESMKALLEKGKLSPGVFYTADCRKTYEDLKAKGVEFLLEPKDQFYGVESIFKDPFGNWFSLTQPKSF